MDVETAKDVMKTFSRYAYHTEKKLHYLAASQALYGCEFIITSGLQGRMQFHCKVCNKEMNSEYAMGEHARSGAHQKNADKSSVQNRDGSITTRQDGGDITTTSLKSQLQNSRVKAIGLQFVCEFRESKTSIPYYKCDLCGAHGRIEAMYLHLIGPKHSKKYISCRVKHPSLTNSVVQEECKQFILDYEGQRINDISTIIGKEHFPYEWINKVHRDAGPSFCGTLEHSSKLDSTRGSLDLTVDGNDAAPSAEDKEEVIVIGGNIEVGTQALPEKLCSLESIMMKLNAMIEIFETPATAPTVNNYSDGERILNTMFHVALGLYECTNYMFGNTTDAITRAKLEQQSVLLNKILGRIQKILQPAFSEKIRAKSRPINSADLNTADSL